MAMKKLAIVVDPFLAPLYRLIGATVYVADSVEEARNALRDIESNPDIGLVLIAAEFYEQMTEAIVRLEKKRPDMLVSRLPTVRERGKPLDVQRELLKALGMG